MSLACSAAILPSSPFIGDHDREDLSQRGDASASPSHPAACESQTLVADRGVKSSGSLQCRTRYLARTTGESYLDGLQRRDKGSLCSDAGGKASPDLQHAPRPTDDRKVVSRAIEASLATKCQPKDPAVVEPRAPHLTSANPTNAQPSAAAPLASGGDLDVPPASDCLKGGTAEPSCPGRSCCSLPHEPFEAPSLLIIPSGQTPPLCRGSSRFLASPAAACRPSEGSSGPSLAPACACAPSSPSFC